MRVRILNVAAALLAAGILPAGAADPRLLNLVMPNAAVLAGVNVDHAKTSVFGQYVLSQVPGAALQNLTTLTGFDPTQDVHEVLAASAGPGSHAGLLLASGTFNASQIAAAAAAKGNTTTLTYGGVTIIVDPKQTHGVAFLDNNTVAVAGDLASVEGAIDRQNASTTGLPAAVITAVNQWSGSEDAWVLSTVPPSSLRPPRNAPAVPGVGPGNARNTFQNLQSAAGGVKFGDTVAQFTAQALAGNSQDATAMANALQLLASMAQLQAQQNQQNAALQALVQTLQVNTNGSTLNVSFSLPENDLLALLKAHAARRPHPALHRRQQ